MCGLTGILAPQSQARGSASCRKRNDQTHRSPRPRCRRHVGGGGVSLGHRRLSILDRSPAGAQPMHSACGRYVVAYNGEIYNHIDLRHDLGAAPARSGDRRAHV